MAGESETEWPNDKGHSEEREKKITDIDSDSEIIVPRSGSSVGIEAKNDDQDDDDDDYCRQETITNLPAPPSLPPPLALPISQPINCFDSVTQVLLLLLLQTLLQLKNVNNRWRERDRR